MCCDFDANLRSLELSERANAEQFDRAAEQARSALAGLTGLYADRRPPEGERMRHQRAVSEAEGRARTARNRAAAARDGYMLLTDKEHTDVDYMRKYQSMIGTAHRLGRARTSARGRDPGPG